MYTNLREMLEARVAETPDRIVLSYEPDGRALTYRQFDEAVNRTANLLLSLGVGKGARVGLLLTNRPEYPIYYFACFKIGAWAGPVNALLKAPEIKYVLDNSQALALITESAFLGAIDEIRVELPALHHVVVVDGEHADTTHLPDTLESVPLTGDDEAIIIYTSGTTGKPKGVLLTHGNLLANARQISGWLQITERDRLLCIMPLFHVNGIVVTTVTPIYAGGAIVLMPRFSASKHWQVVAQFGVTAFGSVATMLSMLINSYPQGAPAGLDISSLRFALCGSAPVPKEVIKQFEALFNCPVVEGYGLSEATCRATFNPTDARRRPGSIGLPIGNEVKIFDEHDRELPAQAVGEIVIRGESVMKGYYRNREASERALRGGWLHSGDVGYYDDEGYFYIVDRISDMIIRGGENIYPREIDELLYEHPAVREAATIGVPDALYGEEVRSFVALKEGVEASADELIAYCRARLADFKCPKQIRFLPELPKGPTGKLLKSQLKALKD